MAGHVDADEDEFIAKIKAAAKNGQSLKSSSIQGIVSTILKESTSTISSADDKENDGVNAFFSHAVTVLTKTNFGMDLSVEHDARELAAPGEQSDEVQAVNAANSIEKTENSHRLEVDVKKKGETEVEELVEVSDGGDSDGSPAEEDDDILVVREFTPPVRHSSPWIRTKPQDVVDEKIVIRVKVEGKLQKFPIDQDDKFTDVFKSLSQSIHLSVNEFSVVRNGLEYIRPSDTPRKLGFEGSEILELVRNDSSGLSGAYDSEPLDKEFSITLKFQDGTKKGGLEMLVNKLDSFDLIKEKYADKRGFSMAVVQKLMFNFDGDRVSNKSTPADLDMEDGDCIDVEML